MAFQVVLSEFASCMGGDESEIDSVFDDYESAEARCREIVDARLAALFRPGISEPELLQLFGAVGEEPFVKPSPASPFVASEYARARVRELCSG